MKSEAQRRAEKKWETEKIDSIHFRVPKGKRSRIQMCAKINGESVNAMLNRLIDKELEEKLG